MVFFNKIRIKKVEGRLNKGDFNKMNKGDFIIFNNQDFPKMREIKVKITSIKNYNTFTEYLQKGNTSKCLPGIDDLRGRKIFIINIILKKMKKI